MEMVQGVAKFKKEGEKEMKLDLSFFIKVLPFVVDLMKAVEGFFGAGTGAQKKGVVMEGTRTAVELVTEVSTGGQKSWWGKFGGAVGNMVDILAGILFPHEEDDEPAEEMEINPNL